jgi:hypothetical protein
VMSINAAAAWALYVRAAWRIVRGFSRRGGTGRRDGLKIHNWAVSWRLIAVVKKPASPVFMRVRGRQASVYGG